MDRGIDSLIDGSLPAAAAAAAAVAVAGSRVGDHTFGEDHGDDSMSSSSKVPQPGGGGQIHWDGAQRVVIKTAWMMLAGKRDDTHRETCQDDQTQIGSMKKGTPHGTSYYEIHTTCYVPGKWPPSAHGVGSA